MRIGIDGRNLKTNRAIFRYTKNLLNWLSIIDKNNEYLLFMEGEQALSEINYLNLSLNWRLVKAPGKIVLRDHWFFKKFIDKQKLDIFFHPDNTEFLNCHPRSVVTIHDVIPFLLPEFSLSQKFVLRWRQELYLKLQRKAIKNSARHIIAVSENTKKDAIGVFGLKGESISVIYEAAEEAYKPAGPDEIAKVKGEYGLSGDYIFCHAGFSSYKNILLLVTAFADFSRLVPGVSLVLGGTYNRKDSYQRQIFGEINKRLLNDRVIFTGFIKESKLPSVYSGAKLFVYPSLYEGFGLPILEAQACGVPVLCSGVSSLPEISGSGAEFFDPNDASDLLNKMLKIYRSGLISKDLVTQGFLNAGKFSWKKAAEQTLEVFESVFKKKL